MNRASSKHATTAVCLLETVLRTLEGKYLDHRDGAGDVQKEEVEENELAEDDREGSLDDGKENLEIELIEGVASSLGDLSTNGSLPGVLKSFHAARSRKRISAMRNVWLMMQVQWLRFSIRTITLLLLLDLHQTNVPNSWSKSRGGLQTPGLAVAAASVEVVDCDNLSIILQISRANSQSRSRGKWTFLVVRQSQRASHALSESQTEWAGAEQTCLIHRQVFSSFSKSSRMLVYRKAHALCAFPGSLDISCHLNALL